METRDHKIQFCYDKAKELEDEICVCFEDLNGEELDNFYRRYKQNKRAGWAW